MSGGSYNYLFCKDADDIISRISDLEDMRDRLTELDYLDAAKETENVILDIKSFLVRSESKIERLNGIWKAVEYCDSNDWGLEEIEEAINNYRNK